MRTIEAKKPSKPQSQGLARTVLVQAGDRVKCVGNVMFSLVIAATDQWVIITNDAPWYLDEYPEEKGKQYAVAIDRVVSIRPNVQEQARHITEAKNI